MFYLCTSPIQYMPYAHTLEEINKVEDRALWSRLNKIPTISQSLKCPLQSEVGIAGSTSYMAGLVVLTPNIHNMHMYCTLSTC